MTKLNLPDTFAGQDCHQFMIPSFHRLARFILRPLRVRKARRAAMLLQELNVESLVFQIPDFRGSFEIGRTNPMTLRLVSGGYENDLISLLPKFLGSGGDAIDVGANIGLYSVFLSASVRTGSRVLAIEPTPKALEYLHRNLERNSIRNCVIFEGAASESEGAITINCIDGAEEYSTLGEVRHPHAPRTGRSRIEVPTRPLDLLVTDHRLHPRVIKMDVEGAELRVLKGAAQVLRTAKPVVLAEMDDRLLSAQGASAREMVAFLHTLGYVVRALPSLEAFPRDWSGTFIGNVIAQVEP